jgi:hypothetical protein
VLTGHEESELSRYFEYHADSAAVVTSASMIADDYDLPTVTKLATLDTVTKLRLLLFGCGLLSAAWHALGRRSSNSDATHPRPEHRMVKFFVSCRNSLEQDGRRKRGLFSKAGEIALDDLCRAIQWMPELDSAMRAFRSTGAGLSEDLALVTKAAAPHQAILKSETYLPT